MRLIILLFTGLLFLGCNSNQASSDEKQSAEAASQTDSLTIDTSQDFVTGQFDFRSHQDFTEITSQHGYDDIYLQKETYQAFKKMFEAAEKDGITLTIISGTRNFEAQKSIWERKWQNSDSTTALGKAQGILEYSSMPMTSRHHWGTDIDINDLNNSYFESGQGKKEYEWLKAHANDFGFYQPYTNKSLNGRTGYNEEKWHWSYMPLAGAYLTYYNRHISNADITGFEGSELANEINMVKNYVNGVSQKIKNYKKEPASTEGTD